VASAASVIGTFTCVTQRMPSDRDAPESAAVPSLPPLLSVVTATRSGSVRLPALIESLAAQDIDAPWEWVVVLDGVTDQTVAVLDGARDVLPVRTVRLEESVGVAGALRAGYTAARGEFVLRCDDDLTLPPWLLSGHLAHHTGRPAHAAPLGVISMTRDVFESSPYASAYGSRANARLLADAYARPAEDRWQHWAACNSVAKAAYDAAGGFDASLGYREDSDLGYRLAASGVEIVIDPRLEVEHRGPATSAAQRSERAFLSGSTLRDFKDRHPDAYASRAIARPSAWSIVTEASSKALRSPRAARSAGQVVDTLLPAVPDKVGGRLAAAAVEAAGIAGQRSALGTWDRSRAPLRPHPIDRVAARVLPAAPGLDRLATSVVGVDTSRPEVALTFDDGPTPGTTEKILEVLRDHGSTATFFVLSNRATRHPALLVEVIGAGHELAVHGPDHRRLTLFTTREVHERTRAARQTIEDLTGHQMRWFRPPYGAQGIRAWRGIRRAGLESVLWGSTFNDWRDLEPEERLRLALDGIRPGTIVLAHDGYAGPYDGVDDGPEPTFDRAAFLRGFLEATSARGLTAVSLSTALSGGSPARASWHRSARDVTI
jgi:peptidoglycan/xylan/chitin deacetylase (PgdA/CDA1 family)/GT2 family glycosyltransferase